MRVARAGRCAYDCDAESLRSSPPLPTTIGSLLYLAWRCFKCSAEQVIRCGTTHILFREIGGVGAYNLRCVSRTHFTGHQSAFEPIHRSAVRDEDLQDPDRLSVRCQVHEIQGGYVQDAVAFFARAL